MAPRIVLITNNGWDGMALSKRFVESGMPPSLIICEARNDDPTYNWPSRTARRIIGNALVDRLARLRQPVDVIQTMAWERNHFDQAKHWLETAFDPTGATLDWPTNIPRVVAENVNEERVLTKVREARPEVLVIFGSGMIRNTILEIPTRGAINGHSSMLPHYKGQRSEFWQCFNDDPRYVGITIHMAVAKADAGDILFQTSTRTTWPSDPFRMRAANTLAILQHYPQVVKDYLDGGIIPQAQGSTSTPVYRKKDMTMELRIALKKRIAG